MPAQKEHQPQQGKERGLAHGEANQGRRKGQREPVEMIRGRSIQLARDAHGKQQAREQKQGPEDCGHA